MFAIFLLWGTLTAYSLTAQTLTRHVHQPQIGDVAIHQIQVKAAETDSGVIDNLSTGGSMSVNGLWGPLRELAATMREMIKGEAAKKMGEKLNVCAIDRLRNRLNMTYNSLRR